MREKDDKDDGAHGGEGEKSSGFNSISNTSRVPRKVYLSRRSAQRPTILLRTLRLERRSGGKGFNAVPGRGKNVPSVS